MNQRDIPNRGVVVRGSKIVVTMLMIMMMFSILRRIWVLIIRLDLLSAIFKHLIDSIGSSKSKSFRLRVSND
jgi:hypothetical protein